MTITIIECPPGGKQTTWTARNAADLATRVCEHADQIGAASPAHDREPAVAGQLAVRWLARESLVVDVAGSDARTIQSAAVCRAADAVEAAHSARGSSALAWEGAVDDAESEDDADHAECASNARDAGLLALDLAIVALSRGNYAAAREAAVEARDIEREWGDDQYARDVLAAIDAREACDRDLARLARVRDRSRARRAELHEWRTRMRGF